jgi:hypothetical protein
MEVAEENGVTEQAGIALTPLNDIQETTNSNLDRDIGIPGPDVLWFSTVLPGNFWGTNFIGS